VGLAKAGFEFAVNALLKSGNCFADRLPGKNVLSGSIPSSAQGKMLSIGFSLSRLMAAQNEICFRLWHAGMRAL
jgi:hypothetical protein